MSWPLDTAGRINSVEFAGLPVKEQNSLLRQEITYLKQRISWINSWTESKLKLFHQLEEVEKQLKVFEEEIDGSQKKMDQYYSDLVRVGGTSGETQVPIAIEEKEVQNNQIPEAPVIHSYTDEPAMFPEGKEALIAFMNAHLKIPEVAIKYKIEGKCYLQFIVSAKGNISNVKVLRGVPDCPECDKEAIQVLKLSSPWLPGKIDGEPVNSVFNLPVVFKLP